MLASTRAPGGPVERIARIAELIETAAGRSETSGTLVPEVVESLHEQGLFRMLLPRVYGGEEVDLITWFEALEALGKLDASTAWCVGQINGCAATASAVPAAVARMIWGDRSLIYCIRAGCVTICPIQRLELFPNR